jgi:hypothetical protein
MDIPIPQLSRSHGRAIYAIVMLAATTSIAAENPAPTPIPRPGTLAAYAGQISLRQTETGGVTITNGNLAEFAARGAVTLGAVSARGAAPPKQPDAAARTHWRTAYRRQRQVITGLERRRALIEVEIDHIEDGGLTARSLALLDRVEEKARVLDEQIKRERGELVRIVREARRHGAEPGWFR